VPPSANSEEDAAPTTTRAWHRWTRYGVLAGMAALAMIAIGVVVISHGRTHKAGEPSIGVGVQVKYGDPRWRTVGSGEFDGGYVWRVREIAQLRPSKITCLMPEVSVPGTRSAADWLRHSVANWHCWPVGQKSALGQLMPPSSLGVDGSTGLPRRSIMASFVSVRGHWTIQSFQVAN